MVTTGILIVGAISLLAFGLTSAKKTKDAAESLLTDISEIDVKKITWTNLYIDLHFKHTNSFSKKLYFNYIFLDLIIGGITFAEIRESNLNKPVEANAVTEHIYQLNISLIRLLLTAGATILSAVRGGKLPDKATLKGYIKVNEFRSEFNKDYPLSKKNMVVEG